MDNYLHYTIELVPPQHLRNGLKPLKVTVMFDYEVVRQEHPYGSTTATELLEDLKNHEYFVNGEQVTFKELERYFKPFTNYEINQTIDDMERRAINEYNGR